MRKRWSPLSIGRHSIYAVQCEDLIKIYDSYLYRESIREIEGRFYDADEKVWCVPLTEENAYTLGLLGAKLDDSLKEMAKAKQIEYVAKKAHIEPRVKAKLYDHQSKAYHFALDTLDRSRGLAILADMGTGKSLMTIAIVGTLDAEEKVKRLLVVCPKSIVGVWEEEFRKFADYRFF